MKLSETSGRFMKLSPYFANKNKTERTLEVGDYVFLKLQPYRQQSLAIMRSLKLATKYYGPFEVLERIG